MRAILFLLFLLLPTLAEAQNSVVITTCGTAAPGSGFSPTYMDATGKLCVNATTTVGVAALTSTIRSSTISVSNTFQSIQALTTGRNGCTVQNTGTHTMWVYFGAIGSATEATAIQLAAGQPVSCAVGGIGVATDQISITGTAGDTFFASTQ